MDSTKLLTSVSFCTGLFGIERGVDRIIPIRVVAYLEIEAFIDANLVAAMEAGVLAPAPIWTDIKTSSLGFLRNRIFMFTGGYPCQPFSRAGKREGSEDERHIWPHIERNIEATRPVCCFFENVGDHLSEGFPEVVTSLRRMGYWVEAGLFTSAEIGSPHTRERLFILAVGNSKSELGFFRETVGGYLADIHQLLDNGGCVGLEPQHKIPAGRDGSFATSEKMADNSNCRLEGWQRGSESGNDIWSGKEVANDKKFGIQWLRSSWRQGIRSHVGAGISFRSSLINCERHVAGQGDFQFDWEAPRTIESGLGCTINGYNFREDLLRAFGNSVQEQTAAIAFFDLAHLFFES